MTCFFAWLRGVEEGAQVEVPEFHVTLGGLKGGLLQGWVFLLKRARAAGGWSHCPPPKAGGGWQTKSLFENPSVRKGDEQMLQNFWTVPCIFWASAFHEVTSSNSSLASGVRCQCKGLQSFTKTPGVAHANRTLIVDPDQGHTLVWDVVPVRISRFFQYQSYPLPRVPETCTNVPSKIVPPQIFVQVLCRCSKLNKRRAKNVKRVYLRVCNGLPNDTSSGPAQCPLSQMMAT